jgi:glycosyltransferase involved in cell wall biosynthesis
VARETVRAYRALFPDDPVTVLEQGGQRYSLRAQVEWPALRRAHADATWVWFHWDVPWWNVPRCSVVYVHDLIYLGDANPLKRWVARRWIDHALHAAGRVVTVSQATAVRLPREAVVIPNGVSGDFAGAWTPQDYVLTVGEDRPHKNLALVEKLEVPWKRADGVSDTDLNALYAGARAVLVPSREEGFGLPVLEAFARGVPVVASDIAALREASGGLATLVPVDDVDAWRHAVRQVWNEPGDAAGRRAWAAQFTWERSAGKLRNVIQELG